MIPTIRRQGYFSIFIVVTGLGACRGDAGSVSDAYSVVDSAGIRIVESRASQWGENAPRIEPQPLLRIGSALEGPNQFASVAHGLLLDDGHIVVAESQAREVRIFDSTGQHVITLGRRGEGPGEFQTVADLFAYRGDSIGVYDHPLRRTTIFPRAGGGYRTVRNEVEGNFLAFGLLSDGRILMYDPGGSYHPDWAPGLQWDTTEIVSMDPADGSYRIIGRLASRQQWIEPGGDSRRLMPAHGSIKAVAEDGFYWATTDRYEIRFYDGDGRLRRIVRRPVEPRPVEPAMIDAYIEANLEWVRRFEGEASVPRYRRRLEEGERGEHVPFFGLAFVDGDGRLWVSEPSWPSLEGPPRQWSVFSEEGAWLGEVEAPERLRIVDGRDDIILGIWRDSLDVPYVQVHRLVH